MSFVFVFRLKMEFHFRRHFPLRTKMKSTFSVGLYIKLFQITPYVNDFQTLNNPVSGQAVGALKISFTGGLLQLTIGFLPSYVSTIRRRASCAGTPGSRRATWPDISVDDVRCHHWLTNQIAEAPLHWKHEPTSI